MEAQEIFYTVGTIALIILSAFIIFFFYTLYKLSRVARAGLMLFNTTARDLQSSIGQLSRSWGRMGLVGIAFKLIRSFLRR